MFAIEEESTYSLLLIIYQIIDRSVTHRVRNIFASIA